MTIFWNMADLDRHPETSIDIIALGDSWFFLVVLLVHGAITSSLYLTCQALRVEYKGVRVATCEVP